ncbi:lytic transglycosylase domain-containing protein [Tropicimonas isoalkanivorans]|uniref:Soluble lytic murein transglycosylase n=1 Tax=Tropicimonas isoalkanivorans TaxID=441112 RepID=A0A1I1NYL4_9RHOB|nr:lytic transglycosylase domain-containing protein [Tropicimonas isoalkanivorans]SFD02555.1 soluble lytic murein transglycosylase [Tropicimonas isoalkanivorans]
MRRVTPFLLFFIVWLPLQSAAAQSSQAEALSQALNQVRAANWRAAAVAANGAGTVGRDIVEWHRLRQGGQATFDAYRDFISRHPDWPGLSLLRTRGEGSIPEDAAPSEVLAYFDGDLPETGTGVVRVVQAHLALGQQGDAEALAVMAWRARSLSPETEDVLLGLFGDLLKRHNTERLDELLWRGETGAAQRMLPRVPEDWQALAEARMALATMAPGVDKRIEAVPAALAEDAGLAYERFNWRIRKGRGDDAIAFMAQRSTSPDSLGRPEKWANWRRIFARRLMRDGKAPEAYALASQHFLVEGSDFADLEWLSGFIALRFLADPELALLHFDRFAEAVRTPISLGRAGYWRGRALTALGDDAGAQEAFAEGAKYQTSYYGLLSAEAAGLPMDPDLAGRETFEDGKAEALTDRAVVKAGLLLLEAGETALAERFLTQTAEEWPRQEVGALAAQLMDRGETHIALMLAKRAAGGGVVLPAAYFPLSRHMDRDLPIPREWALAIARRESEFDPVVVSPAGARGLMQLMPGTARDVAFEIKVPYDRDGLTRRPDYNVTLGTKYLSGLFEVFGEAPVLVSVGYNAGPGRSVDWVSRFGDPRSPEVDIIDWVEMIPFRETRNYVMRVSESILIYRARLSGKTGEAPVAMTAFLREG